MATGRINLQSELVALLGSSNVYYDPPESVKMKYPAIRYAKTTPDSTFANNAVYSIFDCYNVVIISPKADDPAIDKLTRLPMCRPGRPYKADGLYHNPFTLYY